MEILFIGPISPPITGPGVKNKLLIDEFKNKSLEIKTVDTLRFRKTPLNVFSQLITGIYDSNKIVLSVSKKGRFLFCFLFYIIKFFKRLDIYLFPAGGSMDVEIKELPLPLKNFVTREFHNYRKIYPETTTLFEGLKSMGFSNLKLFPNPRKKMGLSWSISSASPKKIIFLSKIRKGKGPLILIETVKELISEGYDIQLDFYGKIESSFKDIFEERVNESSNIVYKGVVDFTDVQKIISEYDIFCLPTMFNEGLPGVLVEASMVGIPFVTTNFRASEEFLVNKENAMVVPRGDKEKLKNAISNIVENPKLAKKIALNFRELSKRFDIEIQLDNVIQDLEIRN